MKRNINVAVTVLFLFLLAGCSGQKGESAMPEKHMIPYEAGLETLDDGNGADTFDGSLDSTESRYYITNDYYNMKSDDDLHIISQFETYQQTTEYTCGPASMKMLLHHYGIDDYSEMQLADMADTDEKKGTKPEAVCRVFDELGFNCESHAGTDPAFESADEAEDYFIDCIDADEPVMVDWENWGGHWQLIIGVDTIGTESMCDDVLIMADPYDVTDQYQEGYFTFPFARFLSMWREGKCAGKTVPYEQPYVTVIRE